MKIKRTYDYYFDEYNSFNEFLKEFLRIIKDKNIKLFISTGALLWFENNKFTDKIYVTDEPNYLIFDDDTVLIFNYNLFSMIDIKVSNLKDLSISEIKNKNNFDFDCYDVSIVEYELNKFTDEYIINPATDETRSAGGSYFKEIIFHLSNEKKICICAEDAESDGYCDIWMENNNLKEIFNDQLHEVWWK